MNSFARRSVAATVVAFTVIGASCAPPTVTLDPSPVTFAVHTVDAAVPGASFVIAADALAGHGDELVVSAFGKPVGGPGTVSIYQQGANLDTWTKTPVVTAADAIKFPNEATVADINGDGKADVVVAGGFFTCAFSGPGCGTLAWFEQTSSGYVRHDVVTNSPEFFHRAVVVDFNGDGVTDLVTVGETFSTATVEWYQGSADPSAPRFSSTPHIIGYGGGSLPEVRDVNGDGRLDVISAQYFAQGRSFAWFERTADPSPANPAGTFVDHTITGVVGGSFQVRAVADLRGDGVTRYLATNHASTTFNGGSPESGVYELDPGADPTALWGVTLRSQGVSARPTSPQTLAPGTFDTGDIDGDGRIDVAVAGDGDARLFWMKQQADGSFKTYVIADNMGQAGGGAVRDFNGDGHADVVFSSYEQDVVRIYSAT